MDDSPRLTPLSRCAPSCAGCTGSPAGGGVGKMQALPAVCQPVLPEEAAASPAASPDAPASSKKHEREQAEVRCAFCYESEEMTLAPSLSRALKLTPIPTRSHLP